MATEAQHDEPSAADRGGDADAPARQPRVRSIAERLGLVPTPPEGRRYHGFISYSHQADADLAAALQRGLQRFAKPWYRARALRVFRDNASMSANPDLWEAIERALDDSEYYILLASPRAAASEWVAKEAARWCATKSTATLLVALTEGEIVWNDGAHDFDWTRTDALPQPLRGAFAREPRFIDLRWAHNSATLSLSDPRFRDAVADLAAPLHGLSKDELAGEEVTQHRRTVRIARAVASGLLLLTAAAVVAAVLAIVAQNHAVHEQKLSRSQALAAESLLALGDDPQLGLLLAVHSAQVARTSQALSALRAVLPDNQLLHTLPAGPGAVQSAAWNPAGTKVVTASATGQTRLWNAATGALLKTFPVSGHATFDQNGTHVLTWGTGTAPRLWSVSGSGAPVVFRQDNAPFGATVSHDGNLVVSGSGDGRAYVWDAHTGRQIRTFAAPDGSVTSVHLSSDDRMLAITDGAIAQIWNVKTGALVRTIHAESVNADFEVAEAAFSPDGKRLVTSIQPAMGLLETQSQVWSIADGRRIATLDGGYARWSERGGFIATTTTAGAVDIYHSANGQLFQTLKGPVAAVGPSAFSPDTASGNIQYVATGSNAGASTVWNATTGGVIATLSGQPGRVTPAGFSPDASRVLTMGGDPTRPTGGDGTARIWATGVVQPQPGGAPRLRQPLGEGVVAGQTSVLGADPVAPAVVPLTGHQAFVTDVRTGARLATLRGDPSVDSVAFDHVGYAMLVMVHPPGHAPAPAQLRHLQGGGLMRTLTGPGSAAVGGALSDDGTEAAAVDGEGRVGVWSVNSGHRLHGYERPGAKADSGADATLKFSPDGRLILAAFPTGGTVVWDVHTGRVLNRIPGPTGGGIVSGALSPDDRYVATVDNTSDDAHLYRVGESGQVRALTGHSAGIYDAAFNQDGTLLATTSPGTNPYDGDGTVRVWSLTDSHPLLTLPLGAGTRVQFSPDGHSLITNGALPFETLGCVVCGGFDYLLKLAKQRETRVLTRAERAQYLG